jgi:2-octaprenyl-6-methoxyphenol hydroxylase
MVDFSHDAIILGGGPAGLTSAILLAREGFNVICADPFFKQLQSNTPHEDNRTIALLQGAIRLLERTGIWPLMQDEATELWTMRVEDTTGRWPRAPDMDFKARELGDEPFGYNIPMPVITAALWKTAHDYKTLKLIPESASKVESKSQAVHITLEDGKRCNAPLLIAADGRNSRARKAAGIKVNRWAYNQTAIALTFSHTAPHENVSVEFHRKPGPFTIIPMQGNRSALVWVETPAEAKRLLGLDDAKLIQIMEDHMHGRLGKISGLSKKNAFPVAGLTAREYAANRVALVGESAHVLPPIGAQGLNLGLRDAALIAELAAQARRWGDDPGAAELMGEYDRKRRFDIFPRTAAVDALNRSLLFGIPPVQGLRAAGVTLLKAIAPLRQAIMQQGLVEDKDLPQIMRRV